MPKVDFTTRQPDFPAMEETTQQYWEQENTFQQSVEQRPADKAYVFYDGPPFATGMPHYGHLLASTTKDVIPRYWTMKGYRVNRVWGWDCHGLPIENMIEKKLGITQGKKEIEERGIDTFNEACEAEVLRLDAEWEKIIGRLGRWVDFENNYKTMDSSFMESVWWGFKQLLEKDLVYEGRKVILYCPRCATPLSNFEIAMDNSYESVTEDSTTYKYPIEGAENTFILAWSTTPWNKLVTPALAVNPDLTYVKIAEGDEQYILAESRLSMLENTDEVKVLETMTGQELTKLTFKPHFDFYPNREKNEQFGVIVADNFVTDEDGTGVVTLAAYGEDDYRVMLEHNIQISEHVDDEGKLKPEIEPWAGKTILEVNSLVNEALAERNLIYQNKPLTHNVATCYRCSTRLYYAPLPAWFIDVQKIKARLLELNEKINWFPEHLKYGRFHKGLENAPDWNISRSRYWGTPMPVWRSADGEQMRVIGSLAELREWAVDSTQAEKVTDIHRQFIDNLEVWVDDDKTIKGTRIPEVFDCWVESGSMPFASVHYPFENKDFFEKNYPAQFISEYIAQTRAWFYCMHVISTGVFDSHAYENVLTTGTILAEDGNKMSKSKKNYPDPMNVINEFGADSLRLYLMSSPVMKGENLNFTEKDVSDLRRKVFVIWWNMLSFYNQFADTSVGVNLPEKAPEHVMDRWLLSKTQTLIAQMTEYMDTYDVVRASRLAIEFVDTLSTWFLRLSRDRLRSDSATGTSQIFGYSLYTLAQLAAPIIPFFSEVVHSALKDENTSVHLTDWPAITEKYQDVKLEKAMDATKIIVESARAKRAELGIKLRQPLASLNITSKESALDQTLLDLIALESNVKEVTWQQTAESELTVEYDTDLTPELKAEGEARELMRSIQNLRRKAGLQVGEQAKVTAPEWPSDWQTEIEAKTNSTLEKGAQLEIVTA